MDDGSINQQLQIYFFYFIFTSCMKKPEKQKLAIGTYIFIILGWRCVENYMYARAGLDFISCCKPTKWSQSSGWLQPQSSPKVTISIYVI